MSGLFAGLKSFFSGPRHDPEEMARIRSMIDTLIASHPVTMFSKSWCPYSNRAKSLLRSLPNLPASSVKVLELDHERDGDAIQAALAEREGVSSVTVPQIYVRQKYIGGSDELVAAQRSGQLAKLLSQT